MNSEKFLVTQTVLLVIIVSWAKAGLVSWGNTFIIAFTGIGMGVTSLLRYRESGCPQIPWRGLFPLLVFSLITLVGLLFPAHKELRESFAYAEQEELGVILKREFTMGGNPEFIERVRREMQIFYQHVEKGDQQNALTRFHLAYRFVANASKTSLKPLFERYRNDIGANGGNWLPNSVTKEKTWGQLWPLVFILFQGIWVFHYVRQRSLLRTLLLLVAVNCVLLGLAGIWQKFTYNASLGRPEIWGIWGTPEPRYYFASFTYKNHWCAFAAVGMGILAGLTHRWLRLNPHNSLRGSPVPIALLGMVVLVGTGPLSGSVLGSLLMAMIAIPQAWTIFHHFLPTKTKVLRISLSFFMAICTLAITAWVVLETEPEIKRETLQKITDRWQNLKDGNLPWRYYHSKDSWSMFMDQPIWGWGLGSTPTMYPLYVSDEIMRQSEEVLAYAHHKERFFGLVHSHNDWFQYLAETGLIGVILLGIGPLSVLLKLNLSGVVSRWSLLACGLLCVFSFVDFPSRTPACLVVFAVCLGASLRYSGLKRSYVIDKK